MSDSPEHPAPPAPSIWPPFPDSPFAPEDLDAVLRPLSEARALPARAFLDPEVFAFEQRAWFAHDWLCVGRVQEVAAPGSWFVAPVTREGVLVVRGDDLEVRAFYNVCRHRGASLLRGRGEGASRIKCSYHGWGYDLRGRLRVAPHTEALVAFDAAHEGLVPVRLETFGGFLFVTLTWDGPTLEAWLDDLVPQFDGVPLETLRSARRVEYDVRANWKVLMENFAESEHFATVHPQLEVLTPARRAESLFSHGPWQGGWMPLDPSRETVSLDGSRHGRPLLRARGDARHGVFDYLLWPTLFLSLQPDYLLAYRLHPVAVDHTRVTLDFLFHPDATAVEGFAPDDVYRFWDATNAQDWSVCERQQTGLSSPGFVPGRYTTVEEGVYEFDRIAAQRYVDP